MSRNKEYVNPAGLRLDGRRPHEARQLQVTFGTVAGADGSCTARWGATRATASVRGPRETATRADARPEEAVVTCEVAVAAFAGTRRRAAQRRTRQAEETAAAVLQVARSLVLLGQYPGAHIDISVEILQLDGSDKVAAVNAACLALADASVAMRGVAVCTDAGLLDGRVVVDLTAEELRAQCPAVTVAVVASDPSRIVWMETAARLSPEALAQLVAGAQESAAAEAKGALKTALEQHATEIMKIQILSAALPGSIHAYTVSQAGKPVPLARYAGRVVVLVNTASLCSFAAANIAMLNDLQTHFGAGRCAVLAFPCAQFANQEPLPDEQLRGAWRADNAIAFEVFDKVRVKGPKADPLWVHVQQLMGPAAWNYTKYVCDGQGVPRARVPHNRPYSDLQSTVESLLP